MPFLKQIFLYLDGHTLNTIYNLGLEIEEKLNSELFQENKYKSK